jgi:uncharacterized protein YndB with AHSA1/START domain
MPLEAVVTRVLDAPRALVYEAWTDPRHVVHWWRPEGFAPPVVEVMDVRPGGTFRVRMPYANGVEYTWYGTYRTVVAGERLVFEDFCEEGGALFHHTVTTVTLEEHDGRTTVTIRVDLALVPDRDPKYTEDVIRHGWASGWEHNLTLLSHYLGRNPR